MSRYRFGGFKARLQAGIAAAALLWATSAAAAPTTIVGNNIINVAGSTSVVFGGQTFVNKGLQGVARLDATTTKDFNGDTFGAFSSLDLNLNAWRKTATGYTGVLYSLPDRGPNGVGSVTFSDYAARTSIFSMNFTPYTGTTDLPASAASQQQLQLTQTGGFFFRDFNGNLTTGLDPGTGSTAFVTQNGKQLPGSTVGAAAGKISVDAEALRFLNDGSFYVGDEYGANVYYFDATGRMQGVVQPPAALIPRNADGSLSFTSLTDATTGRRLNQGIEGMAVTPDNKKLVTVLQSAAMQDSTTDQSTRTNTRLMIYDISTSRTPTAPIADYVLQLPIFNQNGSTTAAPNRTAAQSEVLALNDTQFLVLSRDGNGLGQANVNPVFKSVLLVDITGATNIAGTTFETTAAPIATGGVLNSTIVPVRQTEVLNILNQTQLNKFGINLNNTAPTRLTLTEKWEGMALAPVLEEGAPQDFFLFVGNDNDFLASNCRVGGQDCSQAVTSDGVVLIYRLTLPTYVDPKYLESMITTGPLSVELTDQSGMSVAAVNSGNALAQLNAQRRLGIATKGVGAWAQGTYINRKWDALSTPGTSVKHDGFQGTLGLDVGLNDYFSVGGMLGYGNQSGRRNGFGIDAKSYSFGGYLRFTGGNFSVVTGYSRGHVDLDRIERPAAYGLTATATTDGLGQSFFAEAAFITEVGGWKAGPVLGVYNDSVRVNAYTETGAAGGNVFVPQHTLSSLVMGIGGEIYGEFGGVTPNLRVTYNRDFRDTARTLALTLASAQAAMATQVVTISPGNENYVEIGAGVQGLIGTRTNWNLGYSAQIGTRDRFTHVIRAGVGFAF